MAMRAMSTSKSEPIMNSSRLGAALIMLIMLGGGRRIESIRTHGISLYTNLHAVVAAINAYPALAIECDQSIFGLKSRADNFNGLNHSLARNGLIFGIVK